MKQDLHPRTDKPARPNPVPPVTSPETQSGMSAATLPPDDSPGAHEKYSRLSIRLSYLVRN